MMATNCEDVSAQMMELLYGELPAAARASVDAHVAGCARCRGELEGFEKTRAVARRGLDEAPPARAHAAILQAAAAHLAAQAQPAARKPAVPEQGVVLGSAAGALGVPDAGHRRGASRCSWSRTACSSIPNGRWNEAPRNEAPHPRRGRRPSRR